MSVLTTFLPLYCFAANVAGDAAEVENLLPPGVEPHDYQMTMRDRQKIGGANLIILNGLGIEAWLEPVLKMRSGFPPVIASAGLTNELIWIQKGDRNAAAQESRGPKSGPKGLPNPHIWLDPILAMHAVSNIQRGFVWAAPAYKEAFERNAAAYVARLQKLDADLRAGLAPFQGAKIVTFHNSFPYFARRYGLVVAGVIEEAPDVSPSPQTLARLYKVVRETKPKAIFTEPPFSPRLARQIGADLKVPVATLNTLETGPLKADAYEQLMRENLRVLQEALK